MKKNKLNRLLKFGILLFGVSFFVSCNKEDDLTSEQTYKTIRKFREE